MLWTRLMSIFILFLLFRLLLFMSPQNPGETGAGIVRQIRWKTIFYLIRDGTFLFFF
jgi:hypothetical protein